MPNSAFYVLEKLIQAVDTLATGSGRVQERIASAALHFLPARPEDLPYEDLRRTFIGIRDDIAFEPAKGNEGRIAATMKITSDEDARAIARRILDLYLELTSALGFRGEGLAAWDGSCWRTARRRVSVRRIAHVALVAARPHPRLVRRRESARG
jgi:hypothetical protein